MPQPAPLHLELDIEPAATPVRGRIVQARTEWSFGSWLELVAVLDRLITEAGSKRVEVHP